MTKQGKEQTESVSQKEENKMRERSDADLLRMIIRNHRASGTPITAELLQSCFKNIKGLK